MSSIVFPNKANGHLVEAITASSTLLKVIPGSAQAFIDVTGDYVYALIRGVLSRELVRIDVAGSDMVNGFLSVSRGHGGTTAQAWPVGTLILVCTHADFFNALMQAGGVRTIDYNPNNVLTPAYFGEKVYQSSPAGCERWWKAYNGTDPYWDIITGLPCGSEIYKSIGWDYDLLLPGLLVCWEDYVQPTLWDAMMGSWTGTYWTASSMLYMVPKAGATWHVGFRPILMRITRDILYSTSITFKDTGNHNIGYVSGAQVGPDGYWLELNWSYDLDINYLMISGAYSGVLNITGIDFFICDQFQTYGSTADGSIKKIASTFSGARDASSGDTVSDTATYEAIRCDKPNTNFYCYREFFFFDLTSCTLAQLHSAILRLYAYSVTTAVGAPSFVIQAATATPALGTGDFNAFTGPALSDPKQVGAAGKFEFFFNSDGLTYLESKIGSVVALCLREYDHDFGNVAPTGNQWANIYMQEDSSSDHKPRLTLYGE